MYDNKTKATPDKQLERVRSGEMLTVDELAALLKVPVATIYRWRSQRDGPPGLRIGRYVRFRRAEVDAWLDERRGQ